MSGINPAVAFGSRYTLPLGGAGRTFDYTWPHPAVYTVAASGNARGSTAAPVDSPTFTGLGGGGGNSTNVWNQVGVASLNCSGVAGNGNAVGLGNARVMLNTLKNSIFATAYQNDFQYWRVIFLAAMFANPGVTGECGLYCAIDAGVPKIVSTPSAGYGFQLLNDGTVDFITLNGGAVTRTRAMEAARDLTKVHAYELIMCSSFGAQDATLRALVDGIQVNLPATSSSWATGTKLPPAQLAGARIGFVPTAVAVANNVNGMFVHQMRVMAAPTLAALY